MDENINLLAMTVRENLYKELIKEIGQKVKLVAVSKVRTVEEIMQLYELGQRDFGENYVQELVEKHFILPHDIHWHFIGHLQSNKVKYLAPFIHLIHGVDSFKLLSEINKQGRSAKRVIDCLVQVHIAMEETKFGLSGTELDELINGLKNAEPTEEWKNIRIVGLMGMASFSDDKQRIRAEFKYLASLFDKYQDYKTPGLQFQVLSMGMSADYKIAIEEGSTLVRIGSLLFGTRN